MANEFRLPDIGEGLTDAEIVSWHVAVGDVVARDQLLVEVETAKAVVEITSPFAGIVLHLGGAVGDTVEVGAILVVVGSADESWSGGEQPASEYEPAIEPSARPAAPAGAVRAMPVVRKLAEQHGVDLSTITGSGPGGAITRADVESAIAGSRGGPSADDEERVPLTRMRQTIAEHMARSWREIPHVTVQAEVDATALLEAKADRPLEAIVARCVLPLLEQFPEFNATFEGDQLVVKRRYDLGFAVDTPDGLIVTVVRSADRLTTEALGSAVANLAAKAHDRSVTPDEVTGQTFTISNIGALGGGHGTPIIPWGTTAILSVGRAVLSAVVRDGTMAVAPVMPIDVSYDHRVIDGGLGQRFLGALVEHLEHPDPLL